MAPLHAEHFHSRKWIRIVLDGLETSLSLILLIDCGKGLRWTGLKRGNYGAVSVVSEPTGSWQRHELFTPAGARGRLSKGQAKILSMDSSSCLISNSIEYKICRPLPDLSGKQAQYNGTSNRKVWLDQFSLIRNTFGALFRPYTDYKLQNLDFSSEYNLKKPSPRITSYFSRNFFPFPSKWKLRMIFLDGIHKQS